MDPAAASPSRAGQMETEPQSHTRNPPGRWGWGGAQETRLCLECDGGYRETEYI